ncbi:hypothetical protein METUNv1_03319 [Methyloversatilis universalis FAM5]|uniref:Uncharacterized protein n=1 Tax=Methyloversatilis universalis (strain ATCC BAA-1314 / DSM 25237 / JCM 13912 / CCUG 52030 / FAM5) TaxID=1000565 RepID=F5RGM6_METUF|nr:hypothetical protein [Methyloversatilis universalis]EGK70414.1 hypothetical protein METUNv1_03319 [Methyloversatilis universalis FAM5]
MKRINRFMRAGYRSATRHALPFCAVASASALVAGLSGAALCFGGLAVVGYVLRPSSTVQI